jgi:hypothetical protein
MTVLHGFPSQPGPDSEDDFGLAPAFGVDQQVDRQLETVWRRSAVDNHLDRLDRPAARPVRAAGALG